MAKTYERINWENLPSKNTPINAENLNKMDEAIDKLDDKIVELEENGGSGGSSGDYLEKENPVGTGSFSMNRKANTTVGNCSHAEGYDTTASGGYSHAEGAGAIASGLNSHGEGNCTIASGENAHAEGYRTTASGYHSHAEGFGAQSTLTDGSWTHEYKTNAKGLGSHAEGVFTIAGGRASHSEGEGTIASGTYQHVQGKYNVEDTKNEFAHIVGGGTSDTERKNIHTLDWLGNAVFAGDVINGNGVTMDELKAQIEGMGGGTTLDVHMNDTVVHITSEERTNWNDANTKKHTHSNKSVLDGITSALITAWNSAVTHITDAVKHITSDERTLWNTVSNKADSNHTHNYAGSSSAGGSANSAKKLSSTRYIDGIPFDGSSNLSRLGTCATASYDTAKKVTIGAFDEEGASDAILYIQFTGTYNGGANDTHTISINDGEPLVIYYQGAVFKWETFFSNYPFCDGQIHQFRYFWSPTGSYLELITPSNRAVANNLTTTDEKIALAATMGKQLAETDASLQEQISTLNSNMYAKNLQIGAYFVDSTNINSLNDLSTGIYSINNFDGNILDCPFGGVGMCICAKQSDNYAFQIAMEYNNGIYYRHNDNSTWKSWKQII